MSNFWRITTQLDRKLLRDLYRMRSQAAAIGAVLAAGIAMMVMSLASRDALLRSQASFYRDSRFGELFVVLKRAPNGLVDEVADIEGVLAIDPRLLFDVTLDVPGLTEPAVGRLISLPDPGPQSLNVVRLQAGREPEAGRAGEVIVSEAFAQAHQLRPGDRLRAVLNGRYQWLTVVGIGLSPEYLIQIPPGSLLPDDLRFGVLWMPQSQLAAAFNMEGAFNSLSLQLQPRVNPQSVIDHLDRLLEPYGGLGAYQRHDQISHRYVSDELDQLGVMATIAPAIFLGVAAFLIQVILTRQVGLQREQIATLKAFGFSSREVAWHYLKQMLLLATLAGLGGWLVGLYLAGGMTELYANFYRFPEFQLHWDARLLLASWLISGITAGAGAVRPLRQAFRMLPAEAMRPQAPLSFRTLFWERWGWARHWPLIWRMVTRQMARRPARSLSAVLGIAMGVAVMVVGSFSLDAIEHIVDYQFRQVQRQQVTLQLVEPQGPGVLHSLERLPGVTQVQPFWAAPARLRAAHRYRQVTLLGLAESPPLTRLLDIHGRQLQIPPTGLVVSDKLARLLQVEPGDSLRVELLQGRRPKQWCRVEAIVQEYSGLSVYTSQSQLAQLLGESQRLSGAHLAVDDDRLTELLSHLKTTPRLGVATVKQVAVEAFEKTIAENLLTIRSFNIIFAAIIAVGVVYNTARVCLSEQQRDLATLRVLGFSLPQTSAILLGELALETLLAIPLGCLIGFALAGLITLAMDTELYRIPLVVLPRTYFQAIIVVLLAAIASGWWVQRRVAKLDLLQALKTLE